MIHAPSLVALLFQLAATLLAILTGPQLLEFWLIVSLVMFSCLLGVEKELQRFRR